MELEELSEKEIEILEALTGKSYPSVIEVAEKTGSEYEGVLRIIGNAELIENFKKSRMQKEIEKEMEKKILNSGRIIEQEKKERETRILEAICEGECRSIKSISDVTGISYGKVRRVIFNANLFLELREMRRKEDYEKARDKYRKGMTIEELVKITGIKFYRLKK